MAKHVKKEGLLKKLDALKQAMSNVEAAGFAGGLVIQSAAQQKAPVLTGTLRRSITIRVEKRGSKLLVIIGTNLVYARRIEYGFKGTDSAGRTYNHSGKPYLRPAFDENKAKALSEIAAALKAQIRTVVK